MRQMGGVRNGRDERYNQKDKAMETEDEAGSLAVRICLHHHNVIKMYKRA